MIRSAPALSICAALAFLAGAGAAPSARAQASVSSIAPGDLVEYSHQPEEIQRLIRYALSLTDRNLSYRFGSNSPGLGGMDCSGAVQHVLGMAGLEEVPRSCHTLYLWAEGGGGLVGTEGVVCTTDPVFARLRPGDLLFWEGTYSTGDRDPPISHVKIFLGTLREDGQGVAWGASSGRFYRGKLINGVSVFDWTVPPAEAMSKFVAYGPVPGLRPAVDETPQVRVRRRNPNPFKSVLEIFSGRGQTFR